MIKKYKTTDLENMLFISYEYFDLQNNNLIKSKIIELYSCLMIINVNLAKDILDCACKYIRALRSR